MQIVIFSPHDDPIMGVTLDGYLRGNKAGGKYSYLPKLLINKHSKDNEIYILRRHHSSLRYKAKDLLRLLFWCFYNKINFFNLRIISDIGQVCDSGIFFASARRSMMDAPLSELAKKVNTLKVFHMTHFALKINKVSENIKSVGGHLLVSEANLLKTSGIFLKYYSGCAEENICILPFVPEERFKKTKPFNRRKNIACVFGSLNVFDGTQGYLSEFFRFYNVNTYHPMRKIIYENREAIRDCIDSFITLVSASGKTSPKNANKYYKSFDIVEHLNEYRMAIAPEEIIGVPAIGFVEAMACGCAYIGRESPMYSDVGLISGVNYIGYDGTLCDLIEKIRYYQKHSAELKLIADAGVLYVNENFSPHVVVDRFVMKLRSSINANLNSIK